MYELRINDDDGDDGDDDENAKRKSKEKKGLCCNYKKRLHFFFHPHTPPFLNLFFALFSIHPVDYKYLYAQRRRKTTHVMSYVSRGLLLPRPSPRIRAVCAVPSLQSFALCFSDFFFFARIKTRNKEENVKNVHNKIFCLSPLDSDTAGVARRI